jgi:hypothetical protein
MNNANDYNIQGQVLKSANESMQAWRAGELTGQEITDLLVMAKENGDWVQIAVLALVIACIYKETENVPKGVDTALH